MWHFQNGASSSNLVEFFGGRHRSIPVILPDSRGTFCPGIIIDRPFWGSNWSLFRRLDLRESWHQILVVKWVLDTLVHRCFHWFLSRGAVRVQLIARRSGLWVLLIFDFCWQMCFASLVELQDPWILNYFLLHHSFRLNRCLSIEYSRGVISPKMQWTHFFLS